ncbi:MAG: T9SS type A sorting domain-containing protein [Bacteroidota bacterium]
MKNALLYLALFLSSISLQAQRITQSPLERAFQLQEDWNTTLELTDNDDDDLVMDSLPSAWQLTGRNIIENGHRVFSIKMVDSNVIWMGTVLDASPPPAGSISYVQKSLDGGRNWFTYTIPGITAEDCVCDLSPIDDRVAYVAVYKFAQSLEHQLYKTSNGGETWQLQENYPYSPLYLHFYDENEGWIYGLGQEGAPVMSVTTDGGQTWNHAGDIDWMIPEGRALPEPEPDELLGTFAFSVNSNYEVRDSAIMIGGTIGCWISRDRGYKWELSETPLREDNRLVSVVAMKNLDTFMVASNVTLDNQLASQRAYATTDGGATWTRSIPTGHLSAIQYLPETPHSYISVGHRNFNTGEVGTFRTDDMETWERVDREPLIAMNIISKNQGVGVLGNIPALGDDGNVFKWKPKLDFNVDIFLAEQSEYTISTPKHLKGVFFDYAFENIGRRTVRDVEMKLEVTKNGEVFYTDNQNVPFVLINNVFGLNFEYNPEQFGKYEYRFSADQDMIGDAFFFDKRSFELSRTTLAKDDNGIDIGWGFSMADSTWYGSYGNEFELLEKDTLEAISVFIAPATNDASTFNLGITDFDENGQPKTTPIFDSNPISVTNAGDFQIYQLPEPIILNQGRYLFHAGQNSLQGFLGFGFDYSVDNKGHWVTSPVAGGGFPWENRTNGFNPNLMIRLHFSDASTMTSTEDWRAALLPIRVFPNPFENLLHLQTTSNYASDLTFRILDLNGRELLKRKATRASLETIDVSQLPSGVYFVEVTDGKQTKTIKMVKK